MVLMHKIRVSFTKAQTYLWDGCKLRTDGSENLLATGAKLKYLGGGWWMLWGYHYAGKDVKPYLPARK